MEYLVLITALFLFVVAVFVRETWIAGKERRNLIKTIAESYGHVCEREYTPERFARIPGFYKRHRRETQLDDITWNDLDMDAVFRAINSSLSSIGEEYLYYRLRCTDLTQEEGDHLECVMEYLDTHSEQRLALQLFMNKLGYTGKYSLYEYLDQLDYLGERSNRLNILMLALYPLCIALIPFSMGIGLAGLAMVMVFQILRYFKEKGEIEAYITSFVYVVRLINIAGEISRMDMPALEREQEILRKNCSALQKMKTGSYWVFSQNRANISSGNPLDVILDYLRMISHFDLMVFNHMLRQLNGHLKNVDALIETVGYLETAIMVASYRKSLKEGYCVPQFSECRETEEGCRKREPDKRKMILESAYHPLISKPVKNSITATRGVLLTGSNASGKSTFLKTVALNAILAQTIHTCCAKCYEAPLMRIYSSMALRDDISGGESYYIVEIKALKRILDAADQGDRPILCFVDEVLRGTNTVERIAAATQILKSFYSDKKSPILCFAATHDIELTQLLEEYYDNYHFSEEIVEDDIRFNYLLKPGKADSRNAIRLLGIMGYDEAIIRRATQAAQIFLETGRWEVQPGNETKRN